MSTELKIGAVLGILVVAVSGWFFYTRSADSPDIPLPGDRPISMTGQADPLKADSGSDTGVGPSSAKRKPAAPWAHGTRRANSGDIKPGAAAKKPGVVRPGTPRKGPRPGHSVGDGRTGLSNRTNATAPGRKTASGAERGKSSAAPGRSVPPGAGPSASRSRVGAAQRPIQDQAPSASSQARARQPGQQTGPSAPSADGRRSSAPRPSGSRASLPGGAAVSPASASNRRHRATPPPQASKSATSVREHVVQSGESFALIAQKYFGSQKYMSYLIQANPQVKDPAKLSIGQTLRIPTDPPSYLSPPQPRASRGQKTGAQRTYVVEAGDSFYDIAQRLMDDGTRWPELYELNKDRVGLDPSNLRVGQVLKVPAK